MMRGIDLETISSFGKGYFKELIVGKQHVISRGSCDQPSEPYRKSST